MSGTSLDGLDICYVRFEKADQWKYEILKAETLPYNDIWEDKLRNAVHLNAVDFCQLNVDYGFYLGQKVQEFIQKHQISNIDVIASHGQTIFHQPHHYFTTQIGDGRAIKEVTGITTIYDFRSQDVIKGGNGAPLVPIGDHLLFSEFDACINLGGFSNISFEKEGKRIAFDICPVNIVLNQYAKILGFDYDQDGLLAQEGKVDNDVLNALNKLEFYRLSHPKSLGTEWLIDFFLPHLTNLNPKDIFATCTQHASTQIAEVLNKNNFKKVLFSGGGAYNSYLMNLIKAQTETEIIISDNVITDFKEALIFALMGVLRLRNEVNILSSTTGSKENHSSGLLV